MFRIVEMVFWDPESDSWNLLFNQHFKYAVKARLMLPVFGPDSFCSGAPDKRIYKLTL